TLAGPDEAVFGQTPEVAMASHEAAHQAVLELLDAPRLRELGAFAGEQLLAQCGDGEDVEQGSVGIEGEGLDRPELSRRRRLGHRRSGERNPRCGGTSHRHEFSAIIRHVFLPLWSDSYQ